MRVVSYNILSGGFSSYNYELAAPERLDLLKEVLTLLHADFVGLIDTFRWDALFSNEQIAKMFGYKSAYCINLNDERLKQKGHNNGIAVLTNEEVVAFETISIDTRDAIRTRLKSGGKQLDVYAVYLDDLSEEARISQIKRLLTKVDPNIPALIMGDMNATRKQDLPIINPLIAKFFDDNPKLVDGYKLVIDEIMRGEALEVLEQ